jgi:hypothetical protein
MNIKKTLLAATAALIIAPAVSFAADSTISVNVKAIVPDPKGMSVTAEGGWDATEQTLRWVETTEDFAAFRDNLNVKSTAAVTAHLQVTPQLRSDDDTVGISVKLAGKTLGVGSANREVIATEDEAKAGKLVAAEINAVKPTTGFKPGTYKGAVTMIFESNITSGS